HGARGENVQTKSQVNLGMKARGKMMATKPVDKPVVQSKRGKGKGKGKKKEEEIPLDTNEEWYSEMQYPDGVLLGQEWESHIRQMPVIDYNHRSSTIVKEMALELVHPTNKQTPDGMPIYSDIVK
ncbi:hypothetical protein KI387_039886, partial [Taxus chinensis]